MTLGLLFLVILVVMTVPFAIAIFIGARLLTGVHKQGIQGSHEALARLGAVYVSGARQTTEAGFLTHSNLADVWVLPGRLFVQPQGGMVLEYSLQGAPPAVVPVRFDARTVVPELVLSGDAVQLRYSTVRGWVSILVVLPPGHGMRLRGLLPESCPAWR